MTILKIKLYPEPVLRQKAMPVSAFDDDLRQLVADMVTTMHAAPGVGLAAPQVGVGIRLAVVDPDPGGPNSQVHVLVNPRLSDLEGRAVETEGCLSIPDFTEKVARATTLRLEAQDENGVHYATEVADFLARVIQHEVDHLDGVLFVDRLRGLRKERGRRHLKRLGAL